jgi:hypothetical protein
VTTPEQPLPPKGKLSAADAAAAKAELQAEEEDTSSLIPAITAILAAYVAYRATKGVMLGPWRTLARGLGVEASAGMALRAIALRALQRQYKRKGGDPEELRQFEQKAVDTAVQDAIRVITNKVRWGMSKKAAHTPAGGTLTDPVKAPGAFSDAGGEGEVFHAKPVQALAEEMAGEVAHLVAQSAQNAAASKAGWRKEWHDRRDNRVRYTHAFLGSKSYESHTVDADKPFTSPSGALLRFPGDPLAPIDETANCRCWLTYYQPNVLALAASTRRPLPDPSPRH